MSNRTDRHNGLLEPVSVHDESFWSSKTMQLLMFAGAVIVIIFIVGIVVQVLFGVEVFSIVGAAISGIVALATNGTLRNVKVDGPIRMTQANVPPEAYAQTKPPVIVENAEEVNGK